MTLAEAMARIAQLETQLGSVTQGRWQDNINYERRLAERDAAWKQQYGELLAQFHVMTRANEQLRDKLATVAALRETR